VLERTIFRACGGPTSTVYPPPSYRTWKHDPIMPERHHPNPKHQPRDEGLLYHRRRKSSTVTTGPNVRHARAPTLPPSPGDRPSTAPV
jgi:hypothetical protein